MRGKLMWLALAAVVGVAAYHATALATPALGFSGKTLAVGRFGEIEVNNFTLPANLWQARLKTQGDSDLYVQSNVWAPLGSTGWHSHPGHSLIIVTEGTVTAYDASCVRQDYPVGTGFVDPGGDHVHLLRNEDPQLEAKTIAVQLVPAEATRRIDAPAPAGCPVS